LQVKRNRGGTAEKPFVPEWRKVFLFIDERRHEMFEKIRTAPRSPRCLLARLPRVHKKINAE
jgi:hypothetical protein